MRAVSLCQFYQNLIKENTMKIGFGHMSLTPWKKHPPCHGLSAMRNIHPFYMVGQWKAPHPSQKISTLVWVALLRGLEKGRKTSVEI
jgi:hypothetical protein